MKKNELRELLAKMNTPEHDEQCSRDYNGNTRDYRVASHDGADYLYLSDWYGIAMQTYPVEGLSEEQCADLVAGKNATRD